MGVIRPESSVGLRRGSRAKPGLDEGVEGAMVDLMKSAYELAMERLAKEAPSVKLTADQRARIADIDQRFQAKIAEREVFLGGLIAKAPGIAELEELEDQKRREIAALRDSWEREKDAVHAEEGSGDPPS